MQPINKPPLKLLFGTAEFVDEIQTTVRVGTKWRDLVGTKRLTGIPVFVTGEEARGSIGTAEITGTLFGQFKELAGIGSEFNNLKSNRTIKGLVESLTKDYPDFNPETSQVTVVFFKFAELEEPVENASDYSLADAEDETETFEKGTESVVEETEDEVETETVEETEESSDDSTEEDDTPEESSGEEETDSSAEEEGSSGGEGSGKDSRDDSDA